MHPARGAGGKPVSGEKMEKIIFEDRGDGAKSYWKYSRDCLDCRALAAKSSRSRKRVASQPAAEIAIADEVDTVQRPRRAKPEAPRAQKAEVFAQDARAIEDLEIPVPRAVADGCAIAGEASEDARDHLPPRANSSHSGDPQHEPQVVGLPEMLAHTIHGDGIACLKGICTEGEANRIIDLEPGSSLFEISPPWDDPKGNSTSEYATESRIYIEKLSGDMTWLYRLDHALIGFGVLGPEHHFVDGVSRLKPEPRKKFRKDYDPTMTCFLDGGKTFTGTARYPLSVHVALCDDCTITDFEGRVIPIPRFGAAIFRGDLTHAASGYRVHVIYSWMDFRRSVTLNGEPEIWLPIGPRDKVELKYLIRLHTENTQAMERIENFLKDHPILLDFRIDNADKRESRKQLEKILCHEVGAPDDYFNVADRKDVVDRFLCSVSPSRILELKRTEEERQLRGVDQSKIQMPKRSAHESELRRSKRLRDGKSRSIA